MRVVLLSLFFLSFLGSMALNAAALYDAARKGDVAAVAAALDAGADVNAIDDGGAPLYIAARRGHLETARLLIERGADVNAATKSGTALFAAVTKSKIEVIKLLLEKGADPSLEFGGNSVLHVASRLSCFACLKALVAAGADVNALNINGETPLHLARRLSTPEMVDFLVANGVVPPKLPAISDNLAAADVGEGEAIFVRRCSRCHAVQQGKGNHPQPGLWDIVGRDKASQTDINYSDALTAWEGSWTYEDLNTFIFAPMATTPGVKMGFPGLPNEADRVNLIAYLRTLSKTPLPLP